MVAFVGDDLDPFLVDLGIVMYRVGNQVICVCLPCDMCFLYIYTMTILFMTWFRAPYLPNRLPIRRHDHDDVVIDHIVIDRPEQSKVWKIIKLAVSQNA